MDHESSPGAAGAADIKPKAQGAAPDDRVAKLEAELAQANAKVKAAEERAAQADKDRGALAAQLTAVSGDLKALQGKVGDLEQQAADAKSAALKAKEDREIEALASAGYLPGVKEERARRAWDRQHRQGVAGAWDDYKAELMEAGPALSITPTLHNKGAGKPKSGDEEIDAKVKAYQAAHPDTDYLQALDAVQGGKA